MPAIDENICTQGKAISGVQDVAIDAVSRLLI
jgi:hypothetical protein